MKFYTSDLHLEHTNCIRFDNRPFRNTDEMNAEIVKRWNTVVPKNDDVCVLGDIIWNNADVKYIRQLNGHKYLIRGNHDRLNNEIEKLFVWVKDYAEIKDNGEHLVLCHYPIAHWRNADYGTIHLYGHIHAGRDTRPFEEYTRLMKERGSPYECYNVGCMLHDYTPKTLEQLRSGL